MISYEIFTPFYPLDRVDPEPMNKFFKDTEFLEKMTAAVDMIDDRENKVRVFLDERIIKIPTIKEFMRILNTMYNGVNPGIFFDMYQFVYEEKGKYVTTNIYKDLELRFILISGTYVATLVFPKRIKDSTKWHLFEFKSRNSILDFVSTERTRTKEENEEYKRLGEKYLVEPKEVRDVLYMKRKMRF